MKKDLENTLALYSLWLSITDFEDLLISLSVELEEKIEINKNTNWKWIVFTYNSAIVTIDSLGFVYIDKATVDTKESVLRFLSKNLNAKTISNIEDTFLNQQIIEVPNHKKDQFSSESQVENLFRFLNNIIIKVDDPRKNLKLDHISTDLTVADNKIYSFDELKFSLKEQEYSFNTILNRNFAKLVNKGVYYTHGLIFEEGEVYNLSITNNAQDYIDHCPTLTIKINGKEIGENVRKDLCEQIIKKVIQDTLEEHTILNFLLVTKIEYLSMIINKVSVTNEILKKLNSYLLEDINKDIITNTLSSKELDDESAVEIFIQNLLQAIPRFQMMDIKLKEAYYIKVGNTTTNVNIKLDETIANTLFYGKWKSSINFFVDTAVRAKESLDMYHQTKTLKELEDISYNANYQADIEDIREIQKQKDWSLDERTRKYFNVIVVILGVITFAAEAPLVKADDNSILFNFLNIFLNISIYLGVFLLIFFSIHPRKFKALITRFIKRKISLLLHYLGITERGRIEYKFFEFDKSDYDKHEHRSTHSFYTLKVEENKKREKVKIPITYNTKISSYTLVKKLKEILIIQEIKEEICSFNIFPKLLREIPINKSNAHEYRENYRISGNNKVATKIMYRYKVSNLKLLDFLNYLENDEFMKHYSLYLEDVYSIDEAIKRLRVLSKITPYEHEKEDENGEKKGIELTFYIVYSFVLKFHHMDTNKINYTYNISKDQFRVHYHINKVYYRDEENEEKEQKQFEQSLDDLAKLIDIYFLARLKKIED
ncbi:MAG: Unknown protein [uncultured Sulfurovum sp.]|uniref:Uncharacterized protein n=1 Tax=uncultured Sulfurovum sp. TaxID=269237 RepID=A0A6S6S0S5_9BACT|nr:MAG: Unknown protein [uncultured Sulfurovum sp.]